MKILQSGDKIGFIAPSCGLQNKDLTPAIQYFNSCGLEVVFAPNFNKQYRYMGGTDKERADSINKIYQDPSVKAIFCIRGGSGSSRLLKYLDFDLIKQNPKTLIGLSDSTALQNALITKSNTPCLTGFLPLYDLKTSNINPQTSSSLKSALFEDKHIAFSGNSLIEGTSSGITIGGCLSVLLQLCGTPYFPDLKDKILILEDTEEKTYKIDIMLQQLKQQKNFSSLKGIIFGNFTDCPIIDTEDGTINDCINDFATDLNIPIITDFQYGHIPARYVLPLGIKATITSTKKQCSISW